jgi:hypothetical protein
MTLRKKKETDIFQEMAHKEVGSEGRAAAPASIAGHSAHPLLFYPGVADTKEEMMLRRSQPFTDGSGGAARTTDIAVGTTPPIADVCRRSGSTTTAM